MGQKPADGADVFVHWTWSSFRGLRRLTQHVHRDPWRAPDLNESNVECTTTFAVSGARIGFAFLGVRVYTHLDGE